MFNISNVGRGNNSQPPRMDPDAYAKEYAKEKGISVEQAKEELKAKFGDPQKQGPQAGPMSMNGSIFSM